ncbi:MAG: phosphoribosyltransferase family protein [Kineosporiaceae bacterium]
MTFSDRVDAGRRLAERLQWLRGEDVVVLGLPRGGVVVAYEVAAALDAPLDVIVVRKLGVPWQPELAMGAIGEGGVRVVNQRVVREMGASTEVLQTTEVVECEALSRRLAMVRADHPRVSILGRLAVIVDDGIATGATAVAACQVARAQGARRVVLATPVAPRHRRSELLAVADSVVCVDEPRELASVGSAYEDFGVTYDETVLELLARRRADLEASAPSVTRGTH